MTHTSESLQSTSYCRISQIEVGNTSQLGIQGSSTVQIDDGCINNVLLVPDISSNFLSTYQICHSGDGKTIEFSPNNVVVRDLQDPDTIVAHGQVDHGSRLYKFDGFETSSSQSFIAHVDSLSRLWHE